MTTTRQLKAKTEKVTELEDRVKQLENDVKALRKQNVAMTKILDELTQPAVSPKPTPPKKSA